MPSTHPVPTPATTTSTASTEPIPAARFSEALTALSLPTLHLKVLEIRNSISHLRSSNVQLLPFAMGTETAMGGQPGEPDRDCADAIRENESVIERMQERIGLIRAEVETRGVGWHEFEDATAAEGETDKTTEGVMNNGASASAEEGGALAAARTEEGRLLAGNGAMSNGAASGGQSRSAAEILSHPAWSDGTFQTGVIRGGEFHYDDVPGQSLVGDSQSGAVGAAASNASNAGLASATATNNGGSLSDEQLRRAMEERMRNLGAGEDEDVTNNGSDGGLHL